MSSKIMSSKKLVKSTTLSPAFSKGKSSTLKDVETEYIKNLQQQIYFLELETEYLREQAKKATDIQPKMTKEADRMMYKLKDMQADLDGMKLELTRKDANISMLSNEKLRITAELHSCEDNYRREKSLLTDEVIELKKMKEVADLDIARKDSEVVSLQQRLEQTASELRHEIHSRNLLNSQFEQRVHQHNQTSTLLEEKRHELLQQQSHLHFMEEKFSTSTLAIQDKLSRELKGEIETLRKQLAAAELASAQDRIVKDKMLTNVSKLTQENASLHSQVLDLTKQLDYENLIRAERESQAQAHTHQIAHLRGSEEVLAKESKNYQELLEHERRKYNDLEAQMLRAQDGLSSSEHHGRTIQSRLHEVEARFARADNDNQQLRKDKQILVEHVAQLQKKLDIKEAEIRRMETHMLTLQNDVSGLKSEIDKAKSVHSQSWDQLSRKAGTVELDNLA